MEQFTLIRLMQYILNHQPNMMIEGKQLNDCIPTLPSKIFYQKCSPQVTSEAYLVGLPACFPIQLNSVFYFIEQQEFWSSNELVFTAQQHSKGNMIRTDQTRIHNAMCINYDSATKPIVIKYVILSANDHIQNTYTKY